MARRRMTLRRIDPWSVLKFGAVVNVCLFVIVLLGSLIVWFAIRQLGIIDQACGLATDVGFENCAVNGGNLFRYLVLLGLLWVVIQTGLFVFFAFLHNLIADLVGGISVTMSEEGAITRAGRTTARRAGSRPAGEQTTQRSGLGVPPPREPSPGASTSPAATGGPSAGSAAAATGGSYASPSSRGPADERSDRGSGSTPYDGQAPAAPPTTAPRQPSEPRPGSSGGWPWDPQPGQSGDASGGGGGSERDERDREDREDRDDRDDDRLFGPRDER